MCLIIATPQKLVLTPVPQLDGTVFNYCNPSKIGFNTRATIRWNMAIKVKITVNAQ